MRASAEALLRAAHAARCSAALGASLQRATAGANPCMVSPTSPWRAERAASHLGASSSSAQWPRPPAGAAHRTHKTDAQEHESSSEDGSSGAHHQHPASFQQQENTCWSCHDRHKRGSLLCQSCDKIQPVDSSLTYFDLLGIKQPTFDIDEASLERRYKLLQWTLHPDKAVSRTAEEQDFSAGHASQINQAYGVLRRPLSRANYLLMLAGVPAGDHFEGTLEDPELLMEVMEARERVEGTSDPSELRELLAANRSDQRRVEGQLSAAFGAEDTARAAALVAQLTYYVRLEEAIVAKL